MEKRKLEGTVYLDPQNKIANLGELRRMVRTRQEVYLTAHPEIRDVLNNMVVRAYNNCLILSITNFLLYVVLIQLLAPLVAGIGTIRIPTFTH